MGTNPIGATKIGFVLPQCLAPKGRSIKRYGTLEFAKDLLRSIFYEQFGKQVPRTRTIIALHASRLSARNFSMPLHVSNPTEDIRSRPSLRPCSW
jgi:hypothetical protein